MKIRLSILILFFSVHYCSFAQQKLHVVIAGLSHDHVNRMLDKGKAGEIIITGIVEPDNALRDKKKTEWQLPDSIFFNSVETAIRKTHPDLVMVYKAPSEHLAVIQACLPLHVPVMIEKPLCYSYIDAKKIESLSKKFNTKVFTNFPTIWYTSFNALLGKAGEAGAIG